MTNKRLISRAMSQLSKRRTADQRKGGRPRSKAPRCPCGLMTVECARKRYHRCPL